jgi:hypothetical protein
MIVINNINDDQFLNNLFNQELLVYEDVKGESIWVRWDGEDFLIKSDLNADPVNIIDDSMEDFYSKALDYFNSLPERVKKLLNKKWWFGFQYFPETIKSYPYQRKPKHNLVLCCIWKNGKDYTIEEIDEYSRLLDVESLPFIFKGILSEKQIEAIKYFLNTSKDDLEYVFGETSFAYFFYKLLNPQLSHSFLNDDFSQNVDNIILKAEGKEEKFAIFNPMYDRISYNNSTEYAEIYSLILVSFLNFCQSINLDKIKLKGDRREDVYMFLICSLFNMYVNEVNEDINNFNFVVPEFFNKDKFRINKEIIPNKITRQLVNNYKMDYLFKCIFFSFKNKLKEPVGVLTPTMMNLFNLYLDQISLRIDSFFNKKSEFELGKKGLVDFSDFFEIKYDKDGEQKVYPSIVDEIKKPSDEEKKKKEPFFKTPLK